MRYKLLILLLLVICSSCRESITIDTEDGPQLVGIFGGITNEYTKHQIVVSRTMDFYDTESPAMITSADVMIYDTIDTIKFIEREPGYYETIDSVAGEIGRTYNLSVDFVDDDGLQHFYSRATMRDNVECIDSMAIKPYTMGDFLFKDVLGLYPYFWTLEDEDIMYMVRVKINDVLVSDTLTECEIFSMMGFSGVYYNGPFMVLYAGELPVYVLDQKDPDSLEVLHDGDKVTMLLYSISSGYSGYISEIASSSGSNPMMGSPSNVRTNIYPKEKSVGWFYASSLVEYSMIYEKKRGTTSK